MGCLLIPAIIGLLTCIDVVIVRLFQRRHASKKWWGALVFVWLLGAGVGIWSSFFEWHPSPTLRVFGFPLVLAILRWEGSPGNENWVDYVSSIPHLVIGGNMLLLALLASYPVGLVFWLWGRRASVREKAEGT
jgi:hypothetical protein